MWAGACDQPDNGAASINIICLLHGLADFALDSTRIFMASIDIQH
jgi:hypothetical protein